MSTQKSKVPLKKDAPPRFLIREMKIPVRFTPGCPGCEYSKNALASSDVQMKAATDKLDKYVNSYKELDEEHRAGQAKIIAVMTEKDAINHELTTALSANIALRDELQRVRDENDELRAAANANKPESPPPAVVTSFHTPGRPAEPPSASATPASPSRLTQLTESDRQMIASLYRDWRAFIQRSKKDELPNTAVSPPSMKWVLTNLIMPLKPEFSTLTPSLCHQIMADVANGIVRGKRGAREPDQPTSQESKLQTQTLLELVKPLVRLNAMYSFQHVANWVRGQWNRSRGAAPSASTIARVLKEKGYFKVFVNKAGLKPEVKMVRTDAWRHEIAFLIERYKIELPFMINADETAQRLVPDQQYAWCLDGVPSDEGDVLSMFPLRKQHTTCTFGVSGAGDLLPFQINWKGTDRLLVPGFEGTAVIQYCQAETHWNTVASFKHYVENAVIPYVGRKRAELQKPNAKYLFIIDCAPIHVAKEMRKELATLIGETGGFVVFLPAGATDICQPLDIGCFGVVKASAKAKHLELLCTKLDSRTHLERRKLLVTSKEARALMITALLAGYAALTERVIVNSWLLALDILRKERGRRQGWTNPAITSVDAWVKARAPRAESTLRSQIPLRNQRDAEFARGAVSRATLANYDSLMFRFGCPVRGGKDGKEWTEVAEWSTSWSAASEQQAATEAALYEAPEVLAGGRSEGYAVRGADLDTDDDDDSVLDDVDPEQPSDGEVDDDSELPTDITAAMRVVTRGDEDDDDGAQNDGAQNDGAQIDGAQNDDAQNDDAQNDGAQIDGAQNDGAASQNDDDDAAPKSSQHEAGDDELAFRLGNTPITRRYAEKLRTETPVLYTTMVSPIRATKPAPKLVDLFEDDGYEDDPGAASLYAKDACKTREQELEALDELSPDLPPISVKYRKVAEMKEAEMKAAEMKKANKK